MSITDQRAYAIGVGKGGVMRNYFLSVELCPSLYFSTKFQAIFRLFSPRERIVLEHATRASVPVCGREANTQTRVLGVGIAAGMSPG